MRILVCGGRNYSDYNKIGQILSSFFGPDDVLIQGGANGADALALSWAFSKCIKAETYYANWKKYGKSAGAIRNQRMMDTGIDMVIAFPGGTGTADMVRRAMNAGVRVVTV